MDMPTFSNMTYQSGNIVVDDPSAVLAKNIANVIPTIHHNLKRALHLNLKNHSDYSYDGVPIIEVIPPSPPGGEPRKSFVGVKLDKVLNQTIKVCRRYSMPYIHPEHLGDKLQSDVTSRRSSMPLISNKYLLQVPKPEKKKRRRHSLPVDMEQARKSYSRENKGKHEGEFTCKRLDKETLSKSHDDLSFDGRVHQVYISGYISDNVTFENQDDVPPSHGSHSKQPLRRKNNDGRVLSKMVDKTTEAKTVVFASNPDIVSFTESILDLSLSLPSLTQDDASDSSLSLPSLTTEEASVATIGTREQAIGAREQTNSESCRRDSIYRTKSVPSDLSTHCMPHTKRCVNVASRDAKNQYYETRDTVNKHVTNSHNKRCSCNTPIRDNNNNHYYNNNNHRFISGDILVKRGNKRRYVTDDVIHSDVENGTAFRRMSLSDGVTTKDRDQTRSQTSQPCDINKRNRSCNARDFSEQISGVPAVSGHPCTTIKQTAVLSRKGSPSDTKSVNKASIIDKGVIDKRDLLYDSGFVRTHASCDSIKSNNNNNTKGLTYDEATEFTDTDEEIRLTDGNNNTRSISQISDQVLTRNFEDANTCATHRTGGSEANDFNEAVDGHVCFNYDYNPSSPLEKARSMSQLYDMFNRSKHRRRDTDRPVSYHEDSVNLDICDDINGVAEYESLTDNTALSMEDLENRGAGAEKPTFTNSMFRKAASLCELQNERFKEGFAKLERRVCSGGHASCRIEENTETCFPRVSLEDCSSCASCRSKSSSYHSLLYDTDTASAFQIYQPTVCDVDRRHHVTTADDGVDDGDPADARHANKMTLFKSKKDKLMKQGQDALGTFKDKLRRTKSNPFK